MFQIPKEHKDLKIKWGTRIHSGEYSFRNQKSKHTGSTQKHPTWSAGTASVSKTSWGTPGCRMVVNTTRCFGPLNFTCKFSVDIALKTWLFLAFVNFLKIDSTVGFLPTLLVGYLYPNSTYYTPCVCRSPIQWPISDLFILWNLNCLLSLQHLLGSSSSTVQM